MIPSQAFKKGMLPGSVRRITRCASDERKIKLLEVKCEKSHVGRHYPLVLHRQGPSRVGTKKIKRVNESIHRLSLLETCEQRNMLIW